MAPSMSPASIVRALDVRQPSFPHDGYYYPKVIVAEAGPSAANVRSTNATSGGASGTVIGLAILLVIITLAAVGAIWYIVRQRKLLSSMSTIRVLYNVDSLTQDAEANKVNVTTSTTEEKDTSVDVSLDEKMYDINLSDDTKPKLVPAPSAEPLHVLPSPGLRRKHTRSATRQKLRIVIPSGIAIPDVELVTTATLPNANNGVSSAVSATRTHGGMFRRSTGRTPKSALSSAVTAISTAAIGIVTRREKVEAVYQSNGWAPARMVYLPRNPRDTATRSPSMARKPTRKPQRRMPPTLNVGDRDDEKVSIVA